LNGLIVSYSIGLRTLQLIIYIYPRAFELVYAVPCGAKRECNFLTVSKHMTTAVFHPLESYSFS
jgi:hypothetical protein